MRNPKVKLGFPCEVPSSATNHRLRLAIIPRISIGKAACTQHFKVQAALYYLYP
ncbi:hypothetical protein HMPREF9098_0529 [Kingella denitrificans ATCC 33394]|uniref:Uncharacterized protein n=1 Tax=Kingella denitrificans ATCC 33394 TaxID=888741 RepID=F0EXE5_9NEIS|nr:hypothetical protein HMPREF9098_0529 [Kingella denitrificans ATCC 33394]